jgi:hypothetical protein
MKKFSAIYLLLAIAIASSCVSKQSVVKSEVKIVKDSSFYHKEREVIPAIRDTLYVDSPCDSLGNLKDFDKEIRTSKSSVGLKARNGKIEVLFHQETLVVEKIVKSTNLNSNSVKLSSSKKKIYVTNYKIILALVLSILLNIFLLKPSLFKSIKNKILAIKK